jgi:hypothetical protein
MHIAIEDSPMRRHEKANMIEDTTQCVRTSFAQNDLRDGVLWLEIGRANDLAHTLFPQVNIPLSEPHTDEHSGDNAYFSLRGAAISAINSIFPVRICEAIQSSDLRARERENSLLETTDCVTMKVFGADPRCGVICVRIGYIAGSPILRELSG